MYRIRLFLFFRDLFYFHLIRFSFFLLLSISTVLLLKSHRSCLFLVPFLLFPLFLSCPFFLVYCSHLAAVYFLFVSFLLYACNLFFLSFFLSLGFLVFLSFVLTCLIFHVLFPFLFISSSLIIINSFAFSKLDEKKKKTDKLGRKKIVITFFLPSLLFFFLSLFHLISSSFYIVFSFFLFLCLFALFLFISSSLFLSLLILPICSFSLSSNFYVFLLCPLLLSFLL